MTGWQRIAARLRNGETLYLWDVHHTSLRRAIAHGVVVCTTPDCRVRLTA